jgi:hypothetical protein
MPTVGGSPALYVATQSAVVTTSNTVQGSSTVYLATDVVIPPNVVQGSSSVYLATDVVIPANVVQGSSSVYLATEVYVPPVTTGVTTVSGSPSIYLATTLVAAPTFMGWGIKAKFIPFPTTPPPVSSGNDAFYDAFDDNFGI